MTRDEVDVSQVDMAGNTPLHLAAREGRLSTLSTLLHHGARVHLKVSALQYRTSERLDGDVNHQEGKMTRRSNSYYVFRMTWG